MIKSVDIKNFQSHIKTYWEFDPGVNIIVGLSDSGKSAFMKALRWVKDNRPSGAEFKSWPSVNDGGPTSVEISTEEGSVTRSKDKIEKYIVRKTGKKDLLLKAFGRGVPEEVTQFLNLNEINLQHQLDQHFLLSKSPGEVATYFNKVAKLDKIDLSLSNIKKWITSLSQDIKYKRQQRKDFINQLESFSHLDKFEIEVEVLEDMQKRVLSKRSSERKLQNLCTTYQENKIEIESYQPYLEIEEPLNEILSWIKEKEDLESKRSKLTSLIEQANTIQEDLLKQNSLIKIKTPLLNILRLYKEKEKEESQRMSLDKVISNVISIRQRIKTAEVSFRTLSIRFNKVFPQRCPLCGLAVPHDKK